jgi:flagellar motor switch protein FliN/FliY
MASVHMAQLERVAALARTLVTPLAEAWSVRTGVTVRIDTPEAERAQAGAVVSGLTGLHWFLPIEVTGVHNGILCLIIPKALDKGLERSGPDETFSSMVDEFLDRAGDHLTASLGGPVILDRLGLREVPAPGLEKALSEALGSAELVAVHFSAEVPAQGAGVGGEIVAAFGGRLLHELAHVAPVGGETIARRQPPQSPAHKAPQESTVSGLVARARGLTFVVSVDVGRLTMPLGELASLRPGSTIDLGKTVTEPLDVWVETRRIASADAVVVGPKLGARLRGDG